MTFLVFARRSGPGYDLGKPLEQQAGWEDHAAFMDSLVERGFILLGGPLADEERVVYVVEADSEAEVRATLERDPWNGSHLNTESITPWTIRLRP